MELAGALIGLFAPDTEAFTEENALLTATTGEDGSFAFEEIPYGHWIIAEISAPEFYTVSQEQHHIYIGVDGQQIEIRIDNTLIRGSVQVQKTEAVKEPSPADKRTRRKIPFCVSFPALSLNCMRTPTATGNLTAGISCWGT